MAEKNSRNFIDHLLVDLENRTKLRIGSEFLISEIKDLFYQSFYAYLKAVTSPVAEKILKDLGITARKGFRLLHRDNFYNLEISTHHKIFLLEHIESCFMDSAGRFNPKGYYDEEAINRFNHHLFSVFDEIIDEQMNNH